MSVRIRRHTSRVAHSDYLRRLYPVTIVSARYGGVYEGAPWVAFARHPDELPIEWNAGDVFASPYYEEHSEEIGVGMTPDAAYRNLLEKVERKD
jgi:hypothetical protein